MRAIKDALHGMRKNFLTTFASIVIMTACMLIVGSALLIVANLNAFVVQMQKEDEVAVFIDEAAEQEQIDQLNADLMRQGNIAEINFISKEQALEEYKAMFPSQEDLFANLEEHNPLRASFHIKVADLTKYDETLSAVAEMENVVNVRGSSDVVNTLVNLRNSVTVIGIWIFVILMFISVFIISNTIRMTIFARRTEINIMKYVGATDGYIRRPFLAEGVIMGLISFVVAYIVEWYVYAELLSPLVMELKLFESLAWGDIRFIVMGGFVLFALLMGVLGSMIPMRKHLHV